MWWITLRDLLWRARRLAVGVLGTALVFALTLVLGGVGSALNGEADRAVQAVGADAWVVRAGVSGPFSSLSTLPDTVIDQVARAPGVVQADPFATAFATTGGARAVDVTVIGYRPGGLGPPVPVAGRQPSRPGEALVDTATGYELGETFTLNGLNLTVVGQVEHMTKRGGLGDVYLNIRDAQSALFKGNRLVTAIVTTGVPSDPAGLGLRALAPQEARADVLRLSDRAFDIVDVLRLLLWVVAVVLLGTTLYAAVRERLQELAVLKAMGVTSETVLAALAIQTLAVSLAAAGLAVVASHLIAPAFPMPVHLSAISALTLVGVAALLGTVSGLAALRGAAAVDPALAFRG